MADLTIKKALSFFPAVVTTILGAPAILTLLGAFTNRYDFATPVKELLDNYHYLSDIIRGLLSPYLSGITDILNSFFNHSLSVNKDWFSIFIVMIIYVIAGSKYPKPGSNKGDGIIFLIFSVLSTLHGAIIVAFIPNENCWFENGITVLIPMISLYLGGLMHEIFINLLDKAKRNVFNDQYWRNCYRIDHAILYFLKYIINISIPYFLSGVVIGVILGAFNLAVINAGILGLLLIMIYHGIRLLVIGVKQKSHWLMRYGASLVGGFAGAIILVVANLIFTIDFS